MGPLLCRFQETDLVEAREDASRRPLGREGELGGVGGNICARASQNKPNAFLKSVGPSQKIHPLSIQF